ncbi:MAG: integrase/recombinase [Candidatus Magnetoglobus multicellularis str. Araruama]|uniref:Integrase/recombinase n=1 Tax=Candidatus Magnetoglobus multicellularis str. Araruama TaxID=890399 RepID=A0A1V1P2L4_9BACT|nr:MAG: integrase/recombinase [Candidatus Magnetoglobus multicellularis str. Araruama]
MNNLQELLSEYIKLRRSLGFKLFETEWLLNKFISFLEEQGQVYITTNTALKWATQKQNCQPATWARRLSIVRLFAEYCFVYDTRTEIPPKNLLPYKYNRKEPYIYSDQEVLNIIEGAKNLKSKIGLRPYTYSVLFGLLSVTGMRIQEVTNLNQKDVDLDEGLITIQETKFRKSRIIPIHESTQKMLNQYIAKRNNILGKISSNSFFLSDSGKRISTFTVRSTFVKVSCEIGLRKPSKSHGYDPRLHDFRHRFAIKTIINWYKTGCDVEREISKLATYLGHTHVSDTYWYLSAVPELMQLASKRLEIEDGGHNE